MMIWIVVLITLFIAGNLFWLLPSKSERRRMHLRNEAFKEGLTCREVRDVALLPASADPQAGPWLEYAIASHSEDECTETSLVKSAGELWSDNPIVETSKLMKLPDTVVKVSFREGSIAVLWNEHGELSDVKAITTFLQDLAIPVV